MPGILREITSLLAPIGTWNTLVSYSTRSLKNGLSVSPGIHSLRLSAEAGDPARGRAAATNAAIAHAGVRSRSDSVTTNGSPLRSTSPALPHHFVQLNLRRPGPWWTLARTGRTGAALLAQSVPTKASAG